MDAICPCRTISHRWLTGIRRYPPRPSPRCLNAINWKSSDPTRLAGQPNVFSGSFELTPPIQSSRTGQNSNGQRYGSRSTGPDAPRSKHIGLGTSMEYQLIFGGKRQCEISRTAFSAFCYDIFFHVSFTRPLQRAFYRSSFFRPLLSCFRQMALTPVHNKTTATEIRVPPNPYNISCISFRSLQRFHHINFFVLLGYK